MKRLGLAFVIAAGLGGTALAQSETGTVDVPGNPNGSVVQPGIAKPPAGQSAPAPVKKQPGSTPTLPNDPTIPQIALHPTATIGSGTPVAGAGGTTTNNTGQ